MMSTILELKSCKSNITFIINIVGMYNRYQVSNFFSTSLSNQLVLTQSLSGTTTIPLNTVPSIEDGKTFHIIIAPTDSIHRMILKCFMNSGSVVCNNYDIPTNQTYSDQVQVAIFDLAELFNELYRNTNDFGMVETLPIGWLNLKIRWGRASNPVAADDNIPDSIISLTAGTYYIYYDYLTKTFWTSASEIIDKYICAKVIVDISSISSIEDYRPLNLNPGVVPPQLTQTQINALTWIVNGTIVFNTTTLFAQQYLNWTWYNIPLSSTGGGDVFWPASSSDWEIMLFNGVSGKQAKNSGKKIASTFSSNSAEIPTSEMVYNAIISPLNNHFSDQTYMLWEAVSTSDVSSWYLSLFPEISPTFAAANDFVYVGRADTERRAFLPFVSTWVLTGKFNFSIGKLGTPATNLSIRIESVTSNWLPTGTLINSDANAVWQIPRSQIGTSQADMSTYIAALNNNPTNITYDTTVATTTKTWYKFTLPSTKQISKITKDASCTATTCYILDSNYNVLYTELFDANVALFNRELTAWVYYAAVDSAGSSYNQTSKSGVTFPIAGIDFSYSGWFIVVTDLAQNVYTSTASITTAQGNRFQATSDIAVVTVSKDPLCTATQAIIKNDAGTQLTVATFVWNLATFSSPQLFTTGTYFRIELDNAGASYSRRYLATGVYPKTGTRLIYVTWSISWANNAVAANIASVSTVSPSNNWYSISKIETVGSPINILKWVKAAFVFYNWTYGSETVDSSNYYKIGCTSNIDTTTRAAWGWNGTVYESTKAPATDTISSLDSPSNISTAQWYNITTKISTYWYLLISVTWYIWSRILINGVSVAHNAGVLTTPMVLASNTTYQITSDSNWSNYTISNDTQSWQFPSSLANIIFVSKIGGASYVSCKTIVTEEIISGPWTRKFPYILSSLVSGTLLSKTDSDFSYKLPTDLVRISTEQGAIWYTPLCTIFGVNDKIPWLADNATQYINATPWSIWPVAGANSFVVGKTVAWGKLFVKSLI